MGMRNDGDQKQQGGGPRSGQANGFISSSFRAFSSYLKIVSSGASTVARSAASVASSIVDKDDDANCDQVNWAGFDKLESEGDITWRVLLLGYRSGFQVWDVEEANNVRDLVSRHDGPVSFMQMIPRPKSSKISEDRFAKSRPLLGLCADWSISSGCEQDGLANVSQNCHAPTIVRFYSLRSDSYVHEIKFRSAVYSMRCSSRVVAISQVAQIHCLNAVTLEREYTILTNPIVTGHPGAGGIGYGPLAVGPRWLAYSGSPIVVPNAGRVSPQHLTNSASFPSFSSNGSLVAHYAKESSKQLAAGIATLGDMGYKKLSRYCSELLPDGNNSPQAGIGSKFNGTLNGHLTDSDNVGMVIVRDIVSKVVIAQFRAHKSPISALYFDPSSTLLVTASVQGHNINVFKIMPGLSGNSSASPPSTSYIHLYRLQRGFTNAVIQDISFSNDSSWIMISSSRGTSHLFTINPTGGSVNLQSDDASLITKNGSVRWSPYSGLQMRWSPYSGLQMPNQKTLCAAGPPVSLSVVSRIRNGNNGWASTVTGAAAAATGRISSIPGAIASSFHNCKNDALYEENGVSKARYHLLVFSPSGSMIQYALRIGLDLMMDGIGGMGYELGQECDTRLAVEAIQKWTIFQKQNRREVENNVDIYGDNGSSDSDKKYHEPEENTLFSGTNGMVVKPKISMEEKHHLYISEAELQMHKPQTPLWAKPKVYFQMMIRDGSKVDEENLLGGEIEIERISTHVIEVRSKYLVPIFDHRQPPKSLQTRHSITDNGDAVAELNNGFDKTSLDSSGVAIGGTKGVVNKNDRSETRIQLKIVNNKERLKMEDQLKFVNNNKEGLKMENHFEDEGVEFD